MGIIEDELRVPRDRLRRDHHGQALVVSQGWGFPLVPDGWWVGPPDELAAHREQ